MFAEAEAARLYRTAPADAALLARRPRNPRQELPAGHPPRAHRQPNRHLG